MKKLFTTLLAASALALCASTYAAGPPGTDGIQKDIGTAIHTTAASLAFGPLGPDCPTFMLSRIEVTLAVLPTAELLAPDGPAIEVASAYVGPAANDAYAVMANPAESTYGTLEGRVRTSLASTLEPANHAGGIVGHQPRIVGFALDPAKKAA